MFVVRSGPGGALASWGSSLVRRGRAVTGDRSGLAVGLGLSIGLSYSRNRNELDYTCPASRLKVYVGMSLFHALKRARDESPSSNKVSKLVQFNCRSTPH